MAWNKLTTSWNKGIPCSEETRRKISEAHRKSGHLPPSQKGFKHTEEVKKQISLSQKGNDFAKGKKWTRKSRLKITKKRSHREEEWGKWRDCAEYREWRTQVFKQDNFTCQDCGEQGGRLQADHIKKWAEYPELRFELSNGRTLCESCHKKTPNYGNHYQKIHELSYA